MIRWNARSPPTVPKPVVIDRQAGRWLRDCRDTALQDRVREKIRALANMPDVAGVAGVAKIQGSRDIYRVRVGDYRIVFQWAADSPEILVANIAHRKEVYRGLA